MIRHKREIRRGPCFVSQCNPNIKDSKFAFNKRGLGDIALDNAMLRFATNFIFFILNSMDYQLLKFEIQGFFLDFRKNQG
jgi:hypothetical protein